MSTTDGPLNIVKGHLLLGLNPLYRRNTTIGLQHSPQFDTISDGY